jgi:hypothetical protein
MGNYFNDDEFEGVESVKISAKRNKGKKMVNGVPMATVYEGMSLHRFRTLQNMEQQAWDTVFANGNYARRTDTSTLSLDFAMEHEAEFRRLCQQAARKAGWHAAHRAARNNHPTNNKKGK